MPRPLGRNNLHTKRPTKFIAKSSGRHCAHVLTWCWKLYNLGAGQRRVHATLLGRWQVGRPASPLFRALFGELFPYSRAAALNVVGCDGTNLGSTLDCNMLNTGVLGALARWPGGQNSPGKALPRYHSLRVAVPLISPTTPPGLAELTCPEW